MRLIAAKFVPRHLTYDQKQRRINVCLELQKKANEDPTFTRICRIITGDESWIYSYDPETKQQSSQCKSPQSPRAKKAQQVWSSTKSMLTVFFFFWREGDCSPVPPIATINSDSYSFWEGWEKMCNEKDRNFRTITTGPFFMTTRLPTCPWKPEFVTNNNMVIIPHPLYSRDVLKQCLTSTGNHKGHLTALGKMTSMVLLKRVKKDWITVYVPKGLFWRRWQPKLSKLSQHFFSDLVRELDWTGRDWNAKTRKRKRLYLSQGNWFLWLWFLNKECSPLCCGILSISANSPFNLSRCSTHLCLSTVYASVVRLLQQCQEGGSCNHIPSNWLHSLTIQTIPA
jgi:histone-lysine N-methyltransferase SETMAR